MRKHRSLFFAGWLLAALFLLLPAQSWAQKLPKGVSAQLVATHAASAPGIAKIELWKFTFQPGAIMKNVPAESTEL